MSQTVLVTLTDELESGDLTFNLSGTTTSETVDPQNSTKFTIDISASNSFTLDLGDCKKLTLVWGTGNTISQGSPSNGWTGGLVTGTPSTYKYYYNQPSPPAACSCVNITISSGAGIGILIVGTTDI